MISVPPHVIKEPYRPSMFRAIHSAYRCAVKLSPSSMQAKLGDAVSDPKRMARSADTGTGSPADIFWNTSMTVAWLVLDLKKAA